MAYEIIIFLSTTKRNLAKITGSSDLAGKEDPVKLDCSFALRKDAMACIEYVITFAAVKNPLFAAHPCSAAFLPAIYLSSEVVLCRKELHVIIPHSFTLFFLSFIYFFYFVDISGLNCGQCKNKIQD
ncbi:hypothetical protein M432DRAFT_143129 [Thermoascus aurantiacus ATCC 26904]